jgi:hypothetical protein
MNEEKTDSTVLASTGLAGSCSREEGLPQKPVSRFGPEQPTFQNFNSISSSHRMIICTYILPTSYPRFFSAERKHG